MITPYQIDVPQSDLDDLKERLSRVRWPSEVPGVGWSRGVPVDYLKGLATYWRDSYDWRTHESRLNELPQFMTNIDGQNIHFIHVVSEHPDAMPLMLIHGWPGSIVEFVDLIGPLTNPSDPADAFHVVIPAAPGFGFSGPLREPGWDSKRIAKAFTRLMSDLGYERYGVQGGDMGAGIGPDMGRVDPEHVLGVHVNAATFGFIPLGEVDDQTKAGLTDVERARLARLQNWFAEGAGYSQIQSTRPQTLAYGLNDSPVGQLAWNVDKFSQWTHGGDVPEDIIDRDKILTNVMFYWLPGAGASTAHLYYETMHAGQWPSRSETPMGVAVFAEDVAIRHFSEQLNNIVHWSDFDTGGHFAAMEAPDLLVGDVRKFFRMLR